MHARLESQVDLVGAEHVELQALSTRKLGQTGKSRDERHAVHAQHVALDHGRVDPFRPFLAQPAQGPVALHALLEVRIGAVQRLESRDDAEQIRIPGTIRWRLAARACDQLALVHEVDIAPQRRSAPRIVVDADSLVRRRGRAHAHAAQALRAVDRRDLALREPAAPGAVREDHHLRNDQVERSAAPARLDADMGVLALAVDDERVVHAAERLGTPARLLAPRQQGPREPPQLRQFPCEGSVELTAGDGLVRDHVVEAIVPQVGGDPYPLDPRLGREHLVRPAVHGRVQRQHRDHAALVQRERLDPGVRQHRVLQSGRVHGGHATARRRVEHMIARNRHARRCDVDADAQSLAVQRDRERVIDFGRRAVIDGKRGSGRERQILREGGRRQIRRKPAATRKVARQEAVDVPPVRGCDRPGLQQQLERGRLQFVRRLLHRLVLDAVPVGLHQQGDRLLRDRGRRIARLQRLHVLLLQFVLEPLALDRSQRCLERLGRRRPIPSASLSVEVDRCRVQPEQQRGGLDAARLPAVVVARDVEEAELVPRRDLPEKVEVDPVGLGVGALQQYGRRRLAEPEQHVRTLHLGPLAAGELHLVRSVGARQHRARLEGAVFLK